MNLKPYDKAMNEHLEAVLKLLPPEYKMTILFRHATLKPGELRADVVMSNDDIVTASRCLVRKVKEMQR